MAAANIAKKVKKGVLASLRLKTIVLSSGVSILSIILNMEPKTDPSPSLSLSMLNFASEVFKGVPSLNFRLSLKLKVYVLPSADISQLSARSASIPVASLLFLTINECMLLRTHTSAF